MQFILDNIAAIIVAAVVSLILLSLQLQAGEAMVDQTSYYAAKESSLSMSEMVEDDFQNIGTGVPVGTDIFTNVSATVVEFRRLINVTDITYSTVRYEAFPTDTIDVEGTEVPLFEVQRSVDGVYSGKGPSRMSAFMVELRDAAGTPVVSWGDAEAIYVQFTMIPPYTDENFMRQTSWGRTFRPANL